jgi:hypothetical protein
VADVPVPANDHPSGHPPAAARRTSRRWFLGALAVAAAAALGVLSRGRWRRPDSGFAAGDGFLETTAALCGACFGHHLSEAEVGSLMPVMHLLPTVDERLYATLPTVAAFADRAARSRGAESFRSAVFSVQLSVVDQLMGPVDTRRSALLARISTHERNRRLVRWQAMDRLPGIYAGSAPAWQRRGYTRRPGIGGDPREYTRQGAAYPC